MSSKRLPKKVMLPICGKSVLEHIYDRLSYCKTFNKIVVATTNHQSDIPLKNLCEKRGINYFLGDLNDVLDRFYKAASFYKADLIIRITADCPVVDPYIVDEVVEECQNGNYDYFALAGKFPDGLDCQVFTYQALEKSWKEAKLLSEREHIGTYIENNKLNLFKMGSLEKFSDLLNHRWTLDEPEDYIFMKKIYSKLYKKDKIFLTNDILRLLKKEPELTKINNHIIRNEGYQESLQKDKY
jgi:spore coat polysaccharide biosynthesis protein SpsF (cytidylyltransferase family)